MRASDLLTADWQIPEYQIATGTLIQDRPASPALPADFPVLDAPTPSPSLGSSCPTYPRIPLVASAPSNLCSSRAKNSGRIALIIKRPAAIAHRKQVAMSATLGRMAVSNALGNRGCHKITQGTPDLH